MTPDKRSAGSALLSAKRQKLQVPSKDHDDLHTDGSEEQAEAIEVPVVEEVVGTSHSEYDDWQETDDGSSEANDGEREDEPQAATQRSHTRGGFPRAESIILILSERNPVYNITLKATELLLSIAISLDIPLHSNNGQDEVIHTQLHSLDTEKHGRRKKKTKNYQ
ncbi:hypothetical protein DFP73DRAFT_614638 [Morchella snyderi]|nr:hypothetical protein DFP73DRAFT_614638 [Morchella snyderi]